MDEQSADIKTRIAEVDKDILKTQNKLEALKQKKEDLSKNIKFIDFEKEGTKKKLEEEFVGKILKRCEDRAHPIFVKDKDDKMKRKKDEVIIETTFFKVTDIYFEATFVGLLGYSIEIDLPSSENTTYLNTEITSSTRGKLLSELKAIYGDPGSRDLRKEYSAADFAHDIRCRWEDATIEELNAMLGILVDAQKDFIKKHMKGSANHGRKSLIQKVYDPKLTAKEMARLAGCQVPTVRRYLSKKGLKYKHERQVPEFIERYPEGELPPWYDPKLSVKEMTAKRFKATEMSTRFFLKAHHLPYRHVKAMAPGIDSDLKWYDPNKTIAEMAETTGRTYAAMAIYLRRKKLPFKNLAISLEDDLKNWYDPSRTLKEMVNLSGRTLNGVYEFLRSKNLPYKVNTTQEDI